MLKYSKKKQVKKNRKRKAPKKFVIPESAIQSFTDDYLSVMGIKYRRFPDHFFQWLRFNAPANIQRWFFGIFGGCEDNTCFIPICKTASLCLHLELKTTIGRLHGKQKQNAAELPVQIARSTEDVERMVKAFKRLALQLESYLKEAEKSSQGQPSSQEQQSPPEASRTE